MTSLSVWSRVCAKRRSLAANGCVFLCALWFAIGMTGAAAQTDNASRESDACGPTFSKGGPAAEAYGLNENYPLGTILDRDRQDRMVASYSHFDALLPFHTVAAPAAPATLERDCNPPDMAYRFNDMRYTPDDYLARNPVTGLLIARGNTILVERYQYDRKDTDRFVSQSMVKTMVGMLVGIAHSEGKIRSLEDKAQDYLPELKGSAYGETPLRALLTMSSGVAFTETYDGTDDAAKFARNLRRADLPDAAGLLAQYNTRDAAPETAFHYTGPQTEILGRVVASVMKMRLSDVLAERIWQPIGAEADATWSIDAHNEELAYCCLSARLRDFARFGMLLARGGGGIIPSSWLAEATSAPEDSFRAPRVATPFFGYGYQTWIFPTQRRMFAMLGVHGQVVFVDPDSKIVMVQTAVRLKPNRDPTSRETTALWFGVLRSLGAAATLR